MKIKQATEKDLSVISGWFSNKTEARNWGGPLIPFPLDLEELKIAISWHEANSYTFLNELDQVIGFAQVFHKFGYKHLGRITISPSLRGKGLGYELMETLINYTADNDLDYSLFVYDVNIPAKKLYERIGFEIHAYPEERERIEGCVFMVKKHNPSLKLIRAEGDVV